MDIRLAYGKDGLTASIPPASDVRILEPEFVPALPDEYGALLEGLRTPLGTKPLPEIVKAGDRVGIVFSDITRPTPNHLIVPALLEVLEGAGVSRDDITLFNATGTHRVNTADELIRMLGREVVESCRIVQNDARAEGAHTQVGTTSTGNDLWINSEFLACDVKIITGFIEPHFFAGFSGGGKAVMPGMARLDTVMRNHNAPNIDDPEAVWGVLRGNPIRSEVDEAARMVGPDFVVNVTLNREKKITGVFCGSLETAYPAGCEFVRKTAMAPVDEPFDIVITSNSGYPLDLNLYQAVKGMSAAAKVVKQGGAIIVAAECWDGVPDHGSFGKILSEFATPQELLDALRATSEVRDDQWQAQILALIAGKAEVYVYADGLSDGQIEGAMLKPCRSIGKTVEKLIEKFGSGTRICVLPEGPQTIPYIREAR